jgi:hypothetical protein
MRKQTTTFLLILAAAFGVTKTSFTSPSDPGSGNWPMWGGTPDRNMVSSMKGLPTTWDLKSKKNVKWVAELGPRPTARSLGDIVLSAPTTVRDPNVKDKGVVMAFRLGRRSCGRPSTKLPPAAPATGRSRAFARRRAIE